MILSFAEYFTQAEKLANAINKPVSEIGLHHFPDGESLVQLPLNLPDQVIVFQSLDRPNEKLIELMLLAETAREQGVKRLILITPYLCYMRQDIAFKPGQAVSQRIIGKFLAGLFDAVITVDPHLHRIHDLQEVLPADQVLVLSASNLIGNFLKMKCPDSLLIGPDGESEQWVREVARPGNLDYVVAEKIRHGDTSVEIHLPEYHYARREAILIDDIASSGYTLATAAKKLIENDVNKVSVLVTHALFMGHAFETIKDSGVEKIWSTDSVLHHSNVISLTPLLAEGLNKILSS